MLLHSDMDGGSYELYTIPKDANGSTVVRAPLPLCLAACVGTIVLVLQDRSMADRTGSVDLGSVGQLEL